MKYFVGICDSIDSFREILEILYDNQKLGLEVVYSEISSNGRDPGVSTILFNDTFNKIGDDSWIVIINFITKLLLDADLYNTHVKLVYGEWK